MLIHLLILIYPSRAAQNPVFEPKYGLWSGIYWFFRGIQLGYIVSHVSKGDGMKKTQKQAPNQFWMHYMVLLNHSVNLGHIIITFT